MGNAAGCGSCYNTEEMRMRYERNLYSLKEEQLVMCYCPCCECELNQAFSYRYIKPEPIMKSKLKNKGCDRHYRYNPNCSNCCQSEEESGQPIVLTEQSIQITGPREEQGSSAEAKPFPAEST